MEILTIDQVAEMLNLSKITVYRLTKQGQIPARKVGRCWRFSKEAIEKWISCYPMEEEIDGLLRDLQGFAKEKGITGEDIKKTIQAVRQRVA